MQAPNKFKASSPPRAGIYMYIPNMMFRVGARPVDIWSLVYDWREACRLIGPLCLHKSLCLPENWSRLS